MLTLKIDYKNNTSELCEIGKKYDTDKSSQRNNVTNTRHCHPYTLFYNDFFKNNRTERLKIAELGILEGASLLMWKEYFLNSEIYGFEYNQNLIDHFKKNFNNDRVSLSVIDVTNKNSIENAFANLNLKYDIIIDDTTHQFEDQIRIIENVYQYLNPGGVLIIEDVFKSYDENDYVKRLSPILSQFQDYYFVEMDHINRNSTGWNNDKLLVLIKAGAEPIFKNDTKITIVTPSYRINNLLEIKKSINFNYINEWIIVYDGGKITNNPEIFKGQEDGKIKEYVYKCENGGISGNPQRNHALNIITDSNAMLYYLDDDNVIHPNLYRLLNIISNDKMYTFNQYCRIKGNNIKVNCIDTAMAIIPYNRVKNVRWILDKYNADGFYIEQCYTKCNHVYVDNNLCFYNKITV